MKSKDKQSTDAAQQAGDDIAERNLERDRAALSDYPPLHKEKLRENKVDPIPASRDSLDNHRP